MALTTPLPNNGIEPTMLEPQGIDHLYPDPDRSIQVYLVVVPSCSSDPTDYHWMVDWIVFENGGTVIVRHLQIVRELGCDHLTNWGPITVTATGDITKRFILGELTRSQRKDLERIAQNNPVMVPNGRWNCQHWTADLLKKAVNQKLLIEKDVEEALGAARSVSL
jgi:hypothetical protein